MITKEEKLQLITLAKKTAGNRDLTGAEKAGIDHLLQTARQKPRYEIEIGCGNGHFLTNRASQKQDTFFTGIELKQQRSLKTHKKINRLQLDNASIVCGNAETVVYNLPGAVVDAYHIYFPDPWPKARHKKRRFLRWPHLGALCRSLKPGGQIFFASDIFDYCLQVRILFILHPDLRCLETPPPEELFCSVFANRFSELEKATHFVAAVRI